ncbi:MAG: cytochrome c family protein [Alphaproteobacteria bacterium]|nr:cytochrome c family protein [Alphaproteobacteria bacterium]
MQIRIALLAGLAALAAAVPPARADGDAQAGEALFKKNCTVCHTTEAGKNKIGPSLAGIVGRHSASVADFAYSDAMKKADKTWDAQTLDTYLTNPRALVPGTKMIFVGLKNDQDRQNVIAYLNTLK